MDYVGTRWYKCDFHLHTKSSECFKDKTISNQQWMDRVIEQGINCIAITDHNDYRNIDEMIELGRKQGVVVYPGVEVTCDTSKIHLLVLFDVDKGGEKVRSFLNRIDIDDDGIGKNTGTSMNVFDVCEQAKQKGAIVIASHIDEFNSISTMSAENIKKFLDGRYVDGLQVTNSVIWEQYENDKDQQKMLDSLTQKYGQPISVSDADKWRKTYNKAKATDIPLFSFSDNPCAENESKHGLWGIGTQYTWIKMDSEPTLESLRQAMLGSDVRIKRYIESLNIPEKNPDFWIKSLHVEKSTLSPYTPLKFEFNPQLNCIIGGRGSGKSSVVRFIVGALGDKLDDSLNGIRDEQNNFYKKNTNKDNLGVFKDDTKMIIELIRNNQLYKVEITSVKSSDNQNIKVFKYDEVHAIWESINDENYIDFFRIQAFTQKQIFEVAKEPDALMRIIDLSVNGIDKEKSLKLSYSEKYLAKCAEIRSAMATVKSQSKIETELNDIQEQINAFQKSGISELVRKRQKYNYEFKMLGDFISNGNKVIDEVQEIQNKELVPDLNISEFVENERKELQDLINEYKAIVDIEKAKMVESITKIKQAHGKLKEKMNASIWTKNLKETEKKFEYESGRLKLDGSPLEKINNLLEMQIAKKKEIDIINEQKKKLCELEAEKNEIYSQYVNTKEKITDMRIRFIEQVLRNQDSIKVEIKKDGNVDSFEKMIKSIIQKDNASINEDIEKLNSVVFEGKGFDEFKKIVHDIRNGVEDKTYSAYFRRAIRNIDENQLDKMLMFIPEDDISVSYRPNKGKGYVPLSTASAGQKTTAILTFVLSYGNIPLLLDQPEDDLDNRLVYDLVVKQLKLTKQNRQIIVVSHNANIPVNGESEYIISMSSDRRYVKEKYTGSMDRAEIRKEICDVMEGTEFAFEMRAKKYHLRNTK